MSTLNMSRRVFAVTAGGLALAGIAALAGCSSDKKEEAPAAEEKKEEEPAAPAAEYTLLTEGKLTVVSSPDYPPFESYDENGDWVGYEVDMIAEIGKILGLEIELKPMQFDAIIPAIVAGGQADIGLSGFTIDPERAKEIDFTVSYYIDDQGIVVMKDAGFTPENVDEKLNDSGIVIAVQSGTTGELYAQENYPEATVKGYGNATDSFAALQAGQAQAVITNLAVGQAEVNNSFTDAEVVKPIATGEEYGIVVSKDNPGLRDAISAAIEQLRDNGTLDELVGKHLG